MRSSSVRLPLFATAVIAGLLLVLVSADSSLSPRAALASHNGGADNFLIDMDPTGNTSTNVGTIESCARVNENNIQDADEDGVDAINVDVVTGPGGIPAANPMIAFSYRLAYPTGIEVTGANHQYLLASRAGSTTFSPGDLPPDSDGEFIGESVDYSDWGIIPPESGQGVITRLTLTTSPAIPVGVGELELRSPAHIDLSNNAYLSHNSGVGFAVPGASLAIGIPCPPSVDLSASSVGLGAPTSADVSSPFNVTLNATILNSSSSLLNAKMFIRLDAPSQCVVDTPNREVFAELSPASITHLSLQTFSVRCYRTGMTMFYGRVGLKLQGSPFPDGNPFNNATISSPMPVSIDAVSAPVDFSQASGKLYLSDPFSGRILRSDPNGANLTTIFERPRSNPLGVFPDLYGGKIYYASGYSLRRVNFDGSGEEELRSDFYVMDAHLDQGHLYGTLDHDVARINVDGTGLVRLVNFAWPEDLAVDTVGGRMYWTSDAALRSAALDGRDVVDVKTEWAAYDAVEVDEVHKKVYWTEGIPTARIRRANLDGSGTEDVVSGWASDIAIDPATDTLYWIASGQVWRARLDGASPTPLTPSATKGMVGSIRAARRRRPRCGTTGQLPVVD